MIQNKKEKAKEILGGKDNLVKKIRLEEFLFPSEETGKVPTFFPIKQVKKVKHYCIFF